MSNEIKDYADVLAARLVLCMRQSDSLRADQVIDYYRTAARYDTGRKRLRFAQALLALIEHDVIISIEMFKSEGCEVSGEPKPYYCMPVTLAKKWAICHELNWPVTDFELLVDALEQLAADDCHVLRT